MAPPCGMGLFRFGSDAPNRVEGAAVSAPRRSRTCPQCLRLSRQAQTLQAGDRPPTSRPPGAWTEWTPTSADACREALNNCAGPASREVQSWR